MKLNISSLGIYNPIKNDLEDTLSNLRSAKSALTKAPGYFSQSSYMSSLPSKISDLIRKVNALSNATSRIDNKYNEYISEKKTSFNNLEDYTLNERIGLSDQFQLASTKYNVNSEIFMDENGLLKFGAITGVTAGIKSALPGNNTGYTSSEMVYTDTPDVPKTGQTKGPANEHKPEVINLSSEETIPQTPVQQNPVSTEPMDAETVIPGTHSPGTLNYAYQAQAYELSPEEYKIFCATVYAEAAEGNEYTYSDTMGVASSILNRVEAGNYGGSTITEVVSAPGQFEGYGYENAKFSSAMADPNCIPPDMMQAINDTLAGNRNTEGCSFVGNGTHNTFK